MKHRNNPLLNGSLGNAGIKKEKPPERTVDEPFDLFHPPSDVKGMARNPDRITSIDAARDAKHGADKLRARILEVFRSLKHGEGLTDFELHARHFPDEIYTSVQKRRYDLTTEEFGHVVVDSGVKRPRPGNTRHRSELTVWTHAIHGPSR